MTLEVPAIDQALLKARTAIVGPEWLVFMVPRFQRAGQHEAWRSLRAATHGVPEMMEGSVWTVGGDCVSASRRPQARG